MRPVHFTVSQVRSAAACPRILYFDAAHTKARKLKQPAVTRIWKAGEDDERTACGPLFHAAIERFNRRAAGDALVRQAVADALRAPAPAQELLRHVYEHHVNREALFGKPALEQEAFLATLRRYLAELADILLHALSSGKPLPEILDEMFGDKRRRVDVTFDVGPQGEPVHITGILDYVFYDWRTSHNRIIDYKLTPADKPGDDLFQVCIYALMHHVQHRTQPDVGVLYLHPKRRMVEKSWEEVYAQRHVVFNLLASMREWVRYNEKTRKGLKPPGEPLYCPVCKWDKVCIQRLGPKNAGERMKHWTGLAAEKPLVEPEVLVRPAKGRRVPTADKPPAAAEAKPVGAKRAVTPLADELWLGRTVDDERPVGIPLSALATHVAVVGAAGSGKTWTAKIVAEEAVGQGVPVLAIDPQGDLVQMVKPAGPGRLPVRSEDDTTFSGKPSSRAS